MTLADNSYGTRSSRFWSRTARKYAAAPVRDQAAYEITLERTRSYLAPGDSVLELGCGTGSTALLLADRVSAYLATDFAEGMIAIAEEKRVAEGEGAPRGLRFAVADAFSPDIEAEAGHDAVLAFNFLHLVEEPEALLARVHQLLKPGGLYISKTACLRQRAWLFWPIIKILQLIGKAPHVRMLSFAGVETMIADAGFEIVETGTYPAPFSRFVVARKL